LDPISWPPAVGQGSLAIECRSHDREMLAMLRPLRDYCAIFMAIAERAYMVKLEGGCSVPIGVTSIVDHADNDSDFEMMKLKGFVYSTDSVPICLSAESEMNLRNGVQFYTESNNKASHCFVGIYCDDEKSSAALAAYQLGELVASDLINQGAAGVLAAERAKNA
jgi:porphobilinogen deaminase